MRDTRDRHSRPKPTPCVIFWDTGITNGTYRRDELPAIVACNFRYPQVFNESKAAWFPYMELGGRHGN